MWRTRSWTTSTALSAAEPVLWPLSPRLAGLRESRTVADRLHRDRLVLSNSRVWSGSFVLKACYASLRRWLICRSPTGSPGLMQVLILMIHHSFLPLMCFLSNLWIYILPDWRASAGIGIERRTSSAPSVWIISHPNSCTAGSRHDRCTNPSHWSRGSGTFFHL